jgi:hypothetical protein
MDEKKKQELAGLLGMIGGGASLIGTVAGGGSLISNALNTNKKLDRRYMARVAGQFDKYTIEQLNPQQKAAVKRLTGMDTATFDPAMPLHELPVKINGVEKTLGQIIMDPVHGITAKLPKNQGGLQLREAINQLVVPVQQSVLTQAQDRVGRKQGLATVAQEHVASGGLIPRINRGNKSWNFVGEGVNQSALKQGAMGSTAPTSSLITNEGFTEPTQRMSMNEIAQRLPQGHPSAVKGLRMTPPMVGVAPEAPPVAQPLPATQSNNFVGPETLPERTAAYRTAIKDLRKAGRLRVPGTGMTAVKAAGRNIVRGVARAPIGAKISTGAVVAGGVLKGVADNYAADKMVEDVVNQQSPQPTANANTKPIGEVDQMIIDHLDAKYANVSASQKLARIKELAQSGASMSSNARIWLKYNAAGK